MKYIKTYKDDPDHPTELTRDEAKKLISRYYNESEGTYDELLDTPNRFNCMFSFLDIVAK